MVTSELVAEAFGLARPAGDLVPYAYRSAQTWTLDTADGRILVKHLPSGAGREAVARAMAFERRVRAAGVDVPRPIAPVTPLFGDAAEVDGIGVVRAYEWLDSRPLAGTDDVAEWLGRTLARLHGIEPAAPIQPLWYAMFEPHHWHDWLSGGTREHRPWAPVLRRRLRDVIGASAWIRRILDGTGDFVTTHRDVEPWNVLLTATGPVLVDWDTAGTDSARLEAAHAAVSFAGLDRVDVDAGALRRTLAAYAANGGTAIAAHPDALARRVGLRLVRLAERLNISLGRQPPGSQELHRVEARAAEQLEEFPAFVARVRGWAALW